MNPKSDIVILDMPRRVRAQLPNLNSKDTEKSVISEVGLPRSIKSDAWHGNINVYMLRGQRNGKLPAHFFGKAMLKQAFSAATPILFQVPAVGSSVVLQPKVSPQQAILMAMYRYCRADAIWIIHIPCPLGVALYMEMQAPELDSQTQTRGVKWRPQDKTTIGAALPWSNDLKFVDRVTGRAGQSGGAIRIRTIEDNTLNTVSTPLTAVAWCIVPDIKVSGLLPALNDGIEVPGLNFIPTDATSVEGQYLADSGETGDGIEVNADAIGSPTEISDDSVAAATPPSAPEKPTTTPVTQGNARKAKSNSSIANTKWFELEQIAIDNTALGTWVNKTIDPTQIGRAGEGIRLSYARMVWVSGNNVAGYSRTLKVKLVLSRSPQISAVVEVQDSRNDSSRYIVIAGDSVEFDVMPRNYSSALAVARPRHYNSPYLRTTEAQCDWRYRVLALNRGADTSAVKIRVQVKAGNTTFDVSTKPRPNASTLTEIAEQIAEALYSHEEERYLGDVEASGMPLVLGCESFDEGSTMAVSALPAQLDQTNFISAMPAIEPFEGEIDEGEADQEELDQDEYAIEIFNGRVPIGTETIVPVNLAAIQDLSGNGGLSTIAQKFDRFGHVIPTKNGNFGPQIGSYVIETRLPTTIAGQIEHVSVPGDMLSEAIILAFGLGSILGLATSALQAVGGPTLSGIIQAGRAIFDTVKGIGGKQPVEGEGDSSKTTSIAGPLDISRFIEFLKPVLQNEVLDPTFGAIALKLRDFVGADGQDLADIPLRVFIKMIGSKVERSVFDRLVTPSTTLANEVYISPSIWADIVNRFGEHPATFQTGSRQNACFYQFMSLIGPKVANADFTAFTLKECLAKEVSDDERILVNAMLLQRRIMPN